eukprot:6041587-Pyramimonas_sp.AAC.1
MHSADENPPPRPPPAPLPAEPRLASTQLEQPPPDEPQGSTCTIPENAIAANSCASTAPAEADRESSPRRSRSAPRCRP